MQKVPFERCARLTKGHMFFVKRHARLTANLRPGAVKTLPGRVWDLRQRDSRLVREQNLPHKKTAVFAAVFAFWQADKSMMESF